MRKARDPQCLKQAAEPEEVRTIMESGQSEPDETRIRLALVDDRPLTRASFSNILRSGAQEFTVSAFPSVSELLEALSGEHCAVDLVVLSIGAETVTNPRVRGGIDRLSREWRGLPVVVLSDCQDMSSIKDAFRCGVRGYIPTTVNPAVVIEGLRLVCAGGTYVPADLVLNRLEDERSAAARATRDRLPTLETLTPRQREVLEGLRQAKSNKEIACELRMQENTVKIHVRHILQKLRAANRTHAALLASQLRP